MFKKCLSEKTEGPKERSEKSLWCKGIQEKA